MLDCYRELAEDWLAIPVITGRKTEVGEVPRGARTRVSIEAMMADGWALQSGTSHHLGQNFTRAYGITYSDRDNAAPASVSDLVGAVDADRRRA